MCERSSWKAFALVGISTLWSPGEASDWSPWILESFESFPAGDCRGGNIKDRPSNNPPAMSHWWTDHFPGFCWAGYVAVVPDAPDGDKVLRLEHDQSNCTCFRWYNDSDYVTYRGNQWLSFWVKPTGDLGLDIIIYGREDGLTGGTFEVARIENDKVSGNATLDAFDQEMGWVPGPAYSLDVWSHVEIEIFFDSPGDPYRFRIDGGRWYPSEEPAQGFSLGAAKDAITISEVYINRGGGTVTSPSYFDLWGWGPVPEILPPCREDIQYDAPGDLNGDRVGDLSDAVYLISYLFLGGQAPPCPCAAGQDAARSR